MRLDDLIYYLGFLYHTPLLFDNGQVVALEVLLWPNAMVSPEWILKAEHNVRQRFWGESKGS
jgi:hypothetical protein